MYLLCLKASGLQKKKFAILLPSQDITCESLDCDEDIYLPYVSSSFFPASVFKHC